ncbi:signal peptidase I [Alicyclobacillus contaminans]|uniref:signal peptidase I n=1 Tax=Alicyclobacillus contaminans TaxID=392016 RepID=UPI0003F5DE85|nr:signal peptidase I [Alicyclobacillus contaminans]GMA51558.1 signal peptidase I [Alicyclobacillus contaminans]
MNESSKKSWVKGIWGWIWPIAIGCLVAKGIMTWVVSFAIVPTSSMYPTIPDPCYIFVNHLETEFAKPYRGEVVLFRFPDDPSEIYVKRIIGLPGDTITFKDGKVYVNGKLLNEPYITQPTVSGPQSSYHVPAGHYFMLGDNRNDSSDSRYWIHKYVPASSIIGRADYVIWPISKAGPIH